MQYITLTVTGKTPTELAYRVGRCAAYAKRLIETEPERLEAKLTGVEDHGNIFLVRDLKTTDPIRLRDAAPQLLRMVEKIVQNCYNPALRHNQADGKATLSAVTMPMGDIREAAKLIEIATGRIIEIPAHAPEKTDG